MILGVCGSSSTGKTTLLDTLSQDISFNQKFSRRIKVDARAILRRMGHKSMDKMPDQDLQRFQRQFIEEKLQSENGLDDFCVDRTFVDVAAFWICRDARRDGGLFTDEIVELCKLRAKIYSLHVFLPFGLIPFEPDGYRSKKLGLHREVSDCMRALLIQWQLEWIELDKPDLHWRVKRVIGAIR